MYIIFHRSDLKISAKRRHNFGEIEEMKIQFIRIFAILTLQLLFYFQILMNISRNFTDVCENVKIPY